MCCNYKLRITVVGFPFQKLICTGEAQAPFFCISPPQLNLIQFWCFWLVLQSSFKLNCSFQESSIQEAFLKFIGSWLKVTLHLFWPDISVRVPARAPQVVTGNSSGWGSQEGGAQLKHFSLHLFEGVKEGTHPPGGLWSRVQRFRLDPSCGKRVRSPRDSRCRSCDPLYPRPAFLTVRPSVARPVHALSPATPSGAVCSAAFKRPRAADDNGAAQHQSFD